MWGGEIRLICGKQVQENVLMSVVIIFLNLTSMLFVVFICV